jgi:hypothetical protein
MRDKPFWAVGDWQKSTKTNPRIGACSQDTGVQFLAATSDNILAISDEMR